MHASVHKHVCVHVPMEGHECQVHGCVHVCGRVLPGAGCGSENAPWSSCYIRVSPFLIWELKIARGPALSQRARGRRAAPPGTLTRLLPPPFFGHCPACQSPPQAPMSSGMPCVARAVRGWGGAEALPMSRRWTQQGLIRSSVVWGPPLPQPRPAGRI